MELTRGGLRLLEVIESMAGFHRVSRRRNARLIYGARLRYWFRVCLFLWVVVCGYIGPKFGCADSVSGTPVPCREVPTILGIQIVCLLGVGT